MTLLTDWFCIMQSGKTVDDRNIDAQWLRDMAETYSRELYTACVNYEHFTAGTYGMVHELQAREEGSDVRLFARLEPNDFTIALNKANRGKFFSAEVHPNFRGTGKAYLVGLALTDGPASVGTSQLKFHREIQGHVIADAVPVPEAFAQGVQMPTTAEEAAKGFLASLAAMFSGAKPSPKPQDDDSMNTEQFGELKTLLTNLTARVDKLESGTEKPAESASDDDAGNANDFSALATQITALTEGQKAITEQLAAFAKLAPSTSVPATQGAADDAKELY